MCRFEEKVIMNVLIVKEHVMEPKPEDSYRKDLKQPDRRPEHFIDSCDRCDYNANWTENLTRHKNSKHERFEYIYN